HHDLRAVRREIERDGAPDAAPRARHGDRLAVEHSQSCVLLRTGCWWTAPSAHQRSQGTVPAHASPDGPGEAADWNIGQKREKSLGNTYPSQSMSVPAPPSRAVPRSVMNRLQSDGNTK